MSQARENPAIAESLVRLDAEIARAERCLRLAREGEYPDLARLVEQQRRDLILPLLELLSGCTCEQRAAVDERHQRICALLPEIGEDPRAAVALDAGAGIVDGRFVPPE